MSTIKLGVSACLLGQPVRYDGQHKLDPFLRDTLGAYVEYVPVCPEFEAGFGVPREAMRLEGDPASPRLVTVQTRVDHTDRMNAWARKRVQELEAEGLCGYIFKSKSPSSGMERVKVYNDKGVAVKAGVGLFAAAFMAHFPLLPVEEEGRLQDPELRENFIERIFALQRWRDMLASGRTMRNLIAFHAAHKYLLLSHGDALYREMGRLVAGGGTLPPGERFPQYEALLLRALALKATRCKHVNVLQHILGYFKKQLDADEKQEMLEIIDQYAQGLVPRIVPLTLLNHYVRKYQEPYLATQVYLRPHPIELQLLNHG